MPFAFLSKWLVLVVALFAVPAGLVEFAEYRHVQGAADAPVVEGEVVHVGKLHRWDRPVRIYTIRIATTDTEVRAEGVRGDTLPVGEQVRFHYTGDPRREVRLEREDDPLVFAAFLWGAPLFLALLYLAVNGAVLGPRRSEGVERGPVFWSGRRELRPSIWANLFLALCGLLSVAVGVHGIVNPELSAFAGGFLVLIGVVCSVAMVASVHPHFSGITLREEGFEVRNLGRRTLVSWEEVLAFSIAEGMHSQRNVVCHRVAPDGSDGTLNLPGIRRMTPDELLLLMLEWWVHFGPERKDEDEAD